MLLFDLGATSHSAQDLLLILNSGITPGGTHVIVWDAEIRSGLVMCKRRALTVVLALQSQSEIGSGDHMGFQEKVGFWESRLVTGNWGLSLL